MIRFAWHIAIRRSRIGSVDSTGTGEPAKDFPESKHYFRNSSTNPKNQGATEGAKSALHLEEMLCQEGDFGFLSVLKGVWVCVQFELAADKQPGSGCCGLPNHVCQSFRKHGREEDRATYRGTMDHADNARVRSAVGLHW
jgi:hypothetical protein